MGFVTFEVSSKDLERLGKQFQGQRLRLERAIVEGVNEGGDAVRTIVRQQMVAQSGIKYGPVRKATFSHKASSGSLRYVITAASRPVMLKDVKGARGSKKGVFSLSWGMPHAFKRSFTLGAKGGLFARLPGANGVPGPVRPLLGPNPAKELVKPEMVSRFHRAVETEVVPRIIKRFTRAMMTGRA